MYVPFQKPFVDLKYLYNVLYNFCLEGVLFIYLICLFMVHLIMLSIAQIIYCQIVEWLIEWIEGDCKEADVA